MAKRRRTKIQEATIAHRETMDRILDRKVLIEAKLEYEATVRLLHADLMQHFAGRSNLEITPLDIRRATEAANRAMKRASELASARLVNTTRETQVEAVRSLARFLEVVKPAGTSLDSDRTVHGIIAKDQKRLEKERRQIAKSLSKQIKGHVRQAMKDFEGKTVGDLVLHTTTVAGNQWWGAERAIRTTVSDTFNAAQATALSEIKDELPNVFMRWTEMVNDITGQPLDSRVAKDSLVLHGQIAPIGGVFVMPPHPLAPKVMVGRTWKQPPNRPNDRAVLTPWVPGSNIASWQWKAGKRINLR